ncbi:MAG: DUF2185 domain-containing protein [Bacteroidales bacterium]|jgi:hypothetical protein|nr:DUF2185 domain-containing protein [Bacteroidales bacterium]
MNSKYILQETDIQELIKPMGYCIASNRITIDGAKVGFMYREPREDADDSGWRFVAGDETEDYMNDNLNFMMFDVNYIANIDRAIIPYVHSKIGSEFEREEGADTFRNY